jgi:hypothetical protein
VKATPKPAAVSAPAAPPASIAATPPVTAAQPEPAASPLAKVSGSGWGKIFIGVGIGFVLCLALFTVAEMLKKNRSRGVLSKHKTRN